MLSGALRCTGTQIDVDILSLLPWNLGSHNVCREDEPSGSFPPFPALFVLRQPVSGWKNKMEKLLAERKRRWRDDKVEICVSVSRLKRDCRS